MRILLILVALFVASNLVAEAASRLRVVLINDGANSHKRGADLSAGCDADRGGWENFLSNAFQTQPERLTIDLIQGDDASPTGIRNALAALTVAPTENIFLYYCGHGGWDKARGHFFMLGLEGNLLRSEVRSILMAKRPRGAILITDACTNFADFSFFPQAPQEQFPLFYDLFLRVQGLVDISSSSMGQESWFSKTGSVFSSELSLSIARDQAGFDSNRDGMVTWAEFFPKLKTSVEASFDGLKHTTPAGSPMRSARAQTPAFYFLAEWPQLQKRISVKNSTNERIRLTLHYVTVSPESNNWQWYPGNPEQTAGLAYDLEPQKTTPLLLKPDVGVVAARVRFTAIGLTSGTSFGSGDYNTSPEGGYSIVADPNAVTFKIAIPAR